MVLRRRGGAKWRWFALLLIAIPLCLRASAPVTGGAAPSAAVSQATANIHKAGDTPGHVADKTQHIQLVLLALFLILLLAKLGGDLMERISQPAVLGELIFGVVLGNLALIGVGHSRLDYFIDFLRHDIVLEALAEVGVVLLLFQIGLESTIKEMGKVGLSAFLVALLGVIAPFVLGWGVSSFFLKNADPMVHVFIGSVLCATSVGITARVLQDIGRLNTKEAKIILGAAVIDDVMGLVVLAMVQGVISAKSSGKTVEASQVAMILLKAGGFFAGSIVLGVLLSPKLFRLASFLRAKGVLLTLSLAVCFFFAWAAGMIGLAPIVGAFCAGLILEDASFRELGEFKTHDLSELIQPLAAFLVPVFFVRMGAIVDLSYFGRIEILGFALALTVVAILGKQVCSFGVREKDVDSIAVGLGMIPRGEVGLIVAKIGMGMTIAGVAVVDLGSYSAVVIMVMITTLVTPPILSWRLSRSKPPKGGATNEMGRLRL